MKAKTGTGKSVAFLVHHLSLLLSLMLSFVHCLVSFDCIVERKQLPAIESVLQATSSGRNQRVPPILVLVLSPTRELASQIAAEVNVLLKYHVGIGVQTLIGGTRFKVDQKRLESDPCQVCLTSHNDCIFALILFTVECKQCCSVHNPGNTNILIAIRKLMARPMTGFCHSL